MSTLGPQFDINLAAERLLAELLEPNWLVRKRDPDIGIDREIEQRLAGEPTGQTAYIQLKGQATLARDDAHGKVVMETKTLRYYLRLTVPLFVVLADVTNKRAYFLFIQPWLDTVSDKLSSQETLTVPIPLTNELENHPKFLDSFQRARTFMNERCPGTPESAVRAIERYYEELDERFRVRVTADSHGRRLDIQPRQSATVRLSINELAPEATPALRHALDWGKRFKVSDVAVSASGSKLFEELCKKGPATFEWTPAIELPGTFVFTAKQRGKSAVLPLPAKLNAGAKGISIETDALHCPLHVEMLMGWSGPDDGIHGQVTVKLPLEEWIGRDLLSAPHREAVTAFMRAIGNDAAVSIRFTDVHGRLRFDVPSGKVHFPALKEHAWWFGLLSDAAKAAARFGLSVVIPAPGDITEEHLAGLNLAMDALRSKKIRRHSFNVFHNDSGVAFPELEEGGQVIGTLEAAFPLIIQVFTAQRELGSIEVPRTRCRLTRATETMPDFGYAFRVNSIGDAPIELFVCEDGKARPTLNLEPRVFVFARDPSP